MQALAFMGAGCPVLPLLVDFYIFQGDRPESPASSRFICSRRAINSCFTCFVVLQIDVFIAGTPLPLRWIHILEDDRAIGVDLHHGAPLAPRIIRGIVRDHEIGARPHPVGLLAVKGTADSHVEIP